MLCCVQCLVTHWCRTLCDSMDCSPRGSSVHRDSPGKNTAVGCHALLQGIFPIRGSNPGLPHYRWILYHLSHQWSPLLLLSFIWLSHINGYSVYTVLYISWNIQVTLNTSLNCVGPLIYFFSIVNTAVLPDPQLAGSSDAGIVDTEGWLQFIQGFSMLCCFFQRSTVCICFERNILDYISDIKFVLPLWNGSIKTENWEKT